MTAHELLTKWAENEKDFLAKVQEAVAEASRTAETIFSQLEAVVSEIKKEITEVCKQHSLNKPDITLTELQKEESFWRQRLTIGEANWQFDYNLLPAKLIEGHRCQEFLEKDDEVSSFLVWWWREGWEPAIIRANAYIRIDCQWVPQVLGLQGLVPLTKDSAKKFIFLVIKVGLQPPDFFSYDIREQYKNGIPVADLTKETKQSLPYNMPSPKGLYV